MSYTKDRFEVIEGHLYIYRLDNKTKDYWYAYYKLPGKSRIRKSLRTTRKSEAIIRAQKEYQRLFILNESDLPLEGIGWSTLRNEYRSSKNYHEATEKRLKMIDIWLAQFSDITDIDANYLNRVWLPERMNFWESNKGDKYRKHVNRSNRLLYKNGLRERPASVTFSTNISQRTLLREAHLIKSLLTYAKDRGYIRVIPELSITNKKFKYASTNRAEITTLGLHRKITDILKNSHRSLVVRQNQSNRIVNLSKRRASKRSFRYLEYDVIINRRLWIWCHALQKGWAIRPQEWKQLKWKHLNIEHDPHTGKDILRVEIPANISKNDNHRYVHIYDYGQITPQVIEGTLSSMFRKWKDISKFTKDDDYIFARQKPSMSQDDPCNITQVFQRFLIANELRYTSGGEHVTSYSYRHGGISQVLRSGASTYVVAKYCDTSEHQIRKHYDHVIASELNEDILNAARSGEARKKQLESSRRAALRLGSELNKSSK